MCYIYWLNLPYHTDTKFTKMITPNDTLQLYTALKLHFSTEQYDYNTYHGGLKNPPKFHKRKDKHFFSWLSRKPDPKGILIANLSKNPNMWIGEIFSDKGTEIYLEWKKRQESLTYIFEEEYNKIADKIPGGLIVQKGQHPSVLKAYLQGKISLDTLTILDIILGFMKKWDYHLNHDSVWHSIRVPLLKYRSFMQIDVKKFTKLFLKLSRKHHDKELQEFFEKKT